MRTIVCLALLLFPFFSQAQCPDGATITANEFCIFLTWNNPPSPLPDKIMKEGTIYSFNAGSGTNSDPAQYRDGGGGWGACNSNQTELLIGTITIDGVHCTYTDGTLPLSLLDFKSAKTSSNHPLLSWITAEEQDIDYMELQKSRDTHTWETIATVQPKGNGAAGQHDYTYEDRGGSKGTSFYRIKMVDFDQSFSLSKVLKVTASITGGTDYAITPQGTVTLLFSETAVAGNSVAVYTMAGAKVPAPVQVQVHKLIIDLAKFSSGIYLIKYKDDQGNQSVIKVLR